MNRDADKDAKSAFRSQNQTKYLKVSSQKKMKDPPDVQSGAPRSPPEKDVKTSGSQWKRSGKMSWSATAEGQKSPGAHRKLSDASNASEDLSKDSGCPSGKMSSSDSSSEMSDCPSDGNKHDSPSPVNEFSWIDGGAYLSPDGGVNGGRAPCVKAAGAPQPGATGGALSLFNSSFMDLMMGETTNDLVREVEDLRSENEYLKDEVEELRCEMLEMRDMFQEEEVYQLQDLKLQLEQANKTCRILQYRLRKVERRSIRVAQTGQVDGELVRSLEHDIKVAKSVSVRLYNELEGVQKKNSQLEWENEALREKTQELEVAKQVLQAEVEKPRESTLKKKSSRSTSFKSEKRLSQPMEDDSADLRCQLHFAKEELALMCKKLTTLVSDGEAMREELAKYRSAYGDVDAAQSPVGRPSSSHAREAEVKVHLKLVEEEATLLSRRIVELEVENRGLRAEMADLREKIGRGGEEEEEDQETLEGNLADPKLAGDRTKTGRPPHEEAQNQVAQTGKSDVETSLSQTEDTTSQSPREGPVGGEQDPSDSPEGDNHKNLDRGVEGTAAKDYEALQALRDHSCILVSAVQLLVTPPRTGRRSPAAHTDVDSSGKTQTFLLGPVDEAWEILQAMLLGFVDRIERFLTGEDFGKLAAHEDGCDGDVCRKDRGEQKRQAASVLHSCKDPKVQLSLQILWLLHQWCQFKVSELDGNEGEDKTTSAAVLQGLLQDLVAELRGDSEAEATRGEVAEAALSAVLHGERRSAADSLKRFRQQFPPRGRTRRNWCYLSQEAAQLDQEDPVKTWDHLIMPLSFPELDFEQMSLDRSHTAPEKSAFRIYYSPPSARRVQLAQLKQSPTADGGSVNTASPWCTPMTSFSQLYVSSSTNLSDDMKEMTASWRQKVQVGRQERRGRIRGQWVDVVCSGTQTHIKPQMVSVGLQTDGTDGTQETAAARDGPSRVPSPSLVSARSVDGAGGRVERTRASASSPKLYRRHSSSGASTNLSSSSSASASRDRAMWNLNHHSNVGVSWTRQSGHRGGAGQTLASLSSSKTSGKPASTNRYGMVTEFLRRVSGRTEKPGSGQKTKGGLKNLERVPARPPSAPLQRNDSVTRIVNQRFMKQREEVREGHRGHREEKGGGLVHGVRHRRSTVTAEDGNYGCSSSTTLTFCFARSSRSAQRQPPNHSKVARRRYSPPAGAAAASQLYE